MTKHLPDGASLEHLKKQAKSLMKSLKDGDQSALQRISPYFSEVSDVGLRDTQLVIARECGFDSWEKLRSAISVTKAKEAPSLDNDDVLFVNQALVAAIGIEASEVHFERGAKDVTARFKVTDGFEPEVLRTSRTWMTITSRLTAMFYNSELPVHLQGMTKTMMQDGSTYQWQMTLPQSENVWVVRYLGTWEGAKASDQQLPTGGDIEPIRDYTVKRLISHLPVGSMLVYIGGHWTRIAVITSDGLVYIDSVDVAGDDFDESILAYVREKGLLIGNVTAERIKIEIGSVFVETNNREIEVRGRNIAKGVPETFTLNTNQVGKAIHKPIGKIVNTVKHALGQTPEELIPGVKKHGLVLSGGGSRLQGFETLLANETGLPAQRG